MTRSLPEKHRTGNAIQPGWDLHIDGEWKRVEAREDTYSASFGLTVKLTLAGGQVFGALPRERYLTRRVATD